MAKNIIEFFHLLFRNAAMYKTPKHGEHRVCSTTARSLLKFVTRGSDHQLPATKKYLAISIPST